MDKLKAYFKQDRFAALCGLELVECRPGYSKVQLKINDSHFNAAGVVHGAVLFTMADFCFGSAANAYGRVALSINSSITFVAKGTSGILTAEAREIGRSNKLLTYDMMLRRKWESAHHFTGNMPHTKKINFNLIKKTNYYATICK